MYKMYSEIMRGYFMKKSRQTWFLVFVNVSSEGSKLLVNFIKQVRTVSSKQEILALLPETLPN